MTLPESGLDNPETLASAAQRSTVRRILRDAPDLAPPAPVEELTRGQASEFARAHSDHIIPACEKPASEQQMAWLVAIPEAQGADPSRIPALSASKAGQLIERWAKAVPCKVRQKLVAEGAKLVQRDKERGK